MDTYLRVEPEFLEELKKKLDVRCLQMAINHHRSFLRFVCDQ
jgi:hypothetical protein